MHISSLKKHFSDSLHKNAFYLMLNSVIGGILGFIFWIIVARYYSTSDVGLASAIISTASLLAMLSNLGFNMSMVRFLAGTKNSSKDLINSTFTIAGVFSIILAFIFIVNVSVLSPALVALKLNYIYAVGFALFTFSMVIVTIQDYIFIAKKRTEYVLIKNLILGTKILFPILFVALGAYGIVSSFFISYLLALILGIFLLIPKIIQSYLPALTIKKNIVDEILHFSFGNYIAMVLDNLPGLLLPIIILNLVAAEEAAYFYITWMIASLLYTVPKSVTTSLFSEGSSDEIGFKNAVYKSIKSILVLTIPAIILFFLLGDRILMMFGKDYSINAIRLLELFAISTIPLAINQVYFTIKRIEKNMGSVIKMNALISIGTLGISYYYLPTYGLISIGMAWLLMQILVSCLVVKNGLKMKV